MPRRQLEGSRRASEAQAELASAMERRHSSSNSSSGLDAMLGPEFEPLGGGGGPL